MVVVVLAPGADLIIFQFAIFTDKKGTVNLVMKTGILTII